jgi:hypothetical protein
MHDEDCAIGFRVKNPAGEGWDCYGDRRALDKVAKENLKRCVAAVQASANEIYTAYSNKKAPSTYAAWEIAPTLESARSRDQRLAPLFTLNLERREYLMKRTLWEFAKKWDPRVTSLKCVASGYWKQPIKIDGPRLVIPWSGISAVSARFRSSRVFYQAPGGEIAQSVGEDGKWTAVHDQPVAHAVPFSPLASVSWDDGKEVSWSPYFNTRSDGFRIDSCVLPRRRIYHSRVLLLGR